MRKYIRPLRVPLDHVIRKCFDFHIQDAAAHLLAQTHPFESLVSVLQRNTSPIPVTTALGRNKTLYRSGRRMK